MIGWTRFRSTTRRLLLRAAVGLALVAVLAVPRMASAQHRGGGGAPGGGGFPGRMPGGGMPRGINPDGGMGNGGVFPHPGGGPPPNVREGAGGGNVSTMRGGLQLGPPGRWWDDKHFAKQLRLSTDQQHRMDSIFEQNRGVLLKRFEELQQEEGRMEELTHARTLDENALFAQIDRVAQARADLEKANTHLLFQIRNEMDAEQITRLEDHR